MDGAPDAFAVMVRCGALVVRADGPTLAEVLRVRVPLTDGEAATVAIPLAQALDDLRSVRDTARQNAETLAAFQKEWARSSARAARQRDRLERQNRAQDEFLRAHGFDATVPPLSSALAPSKAGGGAGSGSGGSSGGGGSSGSVVPRRRRWSVWSLGIR